MSQRLILKLATRMEKYQDRRKETSGKRGEVVTSQSIKVLNKNKENNPKASSKAAKEPSKAKARFFGAQGCHCSSVATA